MGPDEIRTLRAGRTRAEFARLLGVTPLTVLRWELPEGTKEARRPRKAMVEALARLASGAPATDPPLPPSGAPSVPPSAAPSAPPVGARSVAVDDVLSADEARDLEPLLARLESEVWPVAADELLALLGSHRLRSASARALATLALAKRDLLARLDVRGTLTALLPLLAEVEAGALPAVAAVKVHVVAALLFGAPDGRLFDPGRVNAHAAAALSHPGVASRDDLVFLAISRLSAARYLGKPVFVRTFSEVAEHLSGAEGAIARCLLEVASSAGADVAGDPAGAARHGAAAFEQGQRLGLHAVVVGVVVDRIRFALHKSVPASEILGMVAQARRVAQEGRIGAIEPVMRLLAGECQALTRLGRFEEALAVCAEARNLAKRAGVPRYLMAAAEVRLLSYRNDQAGLEELASSLEGEVAPSVRAVVRGHGLHVRATLSSLRGGYEEALRLAAEAWEVIEEVAISDYVCHDILIEMLLAQVMSGDAAGARASIARVGLLATRLASDWHCALALRLEGMVLLQEDRFDEALAKMEASMGPTDAAEDLVQNLLGRGLIGLARKRRGHDGADAEIAAVFAELQRRGFVGRPFSPLRDPASDPLSATTPRARVVRDVEEAARTAVIPAEEAPPPSVGLPDFVAAAPSMQRLKRSLAQLSSSRATVLITGESGSGKEIVARALHDLSTRAPRAYVAFNCASVPRELFESHLFGHRRGSFTGATGDEPGVLRAADKGTVFLDEIGELPLDVQPKLLRFLENGEVFPVGERQPRKVDVRVLCATHRDLPRMVRDGAFREDLFYRLNVVPLMVPPLRDRPEDVLALARLFLRRFTADAPRPPELAPDAQAALVACRWPGNVRELRNVIERTLAFGPPPRLLRAVDLRMS